MSLTRSGKMLFLIEISFNNETEGVFFVLFFLEYLCLRKSQFKRNNSEIKARSFYKQIHTVPNV